MVDHLRSFTAEMTRVAREVGVALRDSPTANQ